jgi:peptidylprolyl isomerase
MARPKPGDTVKVHYRLKLKDGTLVESSPEDSPFAFTIGEEGVAPGLTNLVLEMEEGETREVSIPPQNAYGEYQEGLVTVVDRSQVPSHIEPQIGKTLQIGLSSGRKAMVTVKDLDETTVTLDANHPLAGKDLVFHLTLLEVVAARSQD